MKDVSESQYNQPQDKQWITFSRIALEWLNPKRGLDVEKWVVEVVERAYGLNINTLAFDFYQGGLAIFNGSVVPKVGSLGEADLLMLLDRELHKRDMKFVIMNMGAHCANFFSAEHPEWRIQYPSMENYGHPGVVKLEETPCGINGGLYPAYNMCINTPYADELLQELAEMLPRYRIDGIYIEGLYGSDCFCDYCCREFEKLYGYEIPRDRRSFSENKDYRQFRADVVTSFVRRVRKVVGEVSPYTVFMPCPSLFENTYTDYATWGRYSDAITLERQWGRYRWTCPLFEIGMSMQVVRAESGRPPIGTTWLGWHVDRDFSPCTPEHYRLNFAEILLYGGTPQLHAQTIFESDQSEMPTVKEMFDLVEKIRPSMLDAGLVPYVALVLDWSDFNVSANFKGFYQALIESHIPFEVVSKRNLDAGYLAKYKAVLLPDVECLSDGEIDELLRYNRSGGGIVMTYLTGARNEHGGKRRENKLLIEAGIRGPFRIVSNPVAQGRPLCPDGTYYEIVKEHDIGKGLLGKLQSYSGSYMEVETEGGECIARARDLDYSRHNKQHPVTGWYPGRYTDPLLIVNEGSGRGRIACFTGEFDKAAYETGLPGALDTLAEAAVWAASKQPFIETDLPPTVEISVHYSPSMKAYTVILVNKTTNDIGRGMVVRHVVPIKDSHITIRCDGEVREVNNFGRSSITWKNENDCCTVSLKKVQEYEAIVIYLK